MLKSNLFISILKNSPLTSIDLIIKNRTQEVLLGLRKNRPAKGYWFVPGGRIYKDESIANAFKRISKNELGIEYNIGESRFLGVFEHFYSDNRFNEDFSTHYIVLGFEIMLEKTPVSVDEQHEAFRWFDMVALLNDPSVHRYTKDYFRQEKGLR